ncbi:hypothetical protein ACSS6W_002968 [Trichoderma asperelloides]|uniref:Uncharacterized protein n=2 Tax=Trichoderma asperellum TaxID=101201 RepID=A0A6V8QRR9_TRIAP|nr:hypothetical protein M441DRAFT_55690 [Trichoderma asperellum CBS 433.97]KAH8127420.1 hypothetical protein LI328DRAFT_130602 [Trichoderma asperelloides]PTB44664.1 hypothetical protein M441DRAFT_55690 [Trichoderma asperellum CBS 433.97]UKZ87409.1 hypothetical protein TrAFT101_003213 [Trichoderma asperellum]GFP55045.1 hypothetical protein TASIC1_0004067000 [Trichoderma asperellum]
MGQSLFERIQAKLELFRLEQRYTRRRHRRSTFVSNAVYVDGEYVYQTPNSTGSSSESSASRTDALHGDRASPSPRSPMHSMSPEPTTPTMETLPERKKLNRFSSMPGFGSRTEEQQRTVQRRTSMIR